MFTRKKAREYLFKLVFELGFNDAENSQSYENLMIQLNGGEIDIERENQADNAVDFSHMHDDEEEMDFVLDEEDFNKGRENVEFLKEMFEGIVEKYEEIKNILSRSITNYTIDRLFKVDLAILIVAAYELTYYKSTPEKIVINEAVELSKKYSTEKSYSFINSSIVNVLKIVKEERIGE